MRSRRRKVGMSKNGEWKLKVAIASSIVFFFFLIGLLRSKEENTNFVCQLTTLYCHNIYVRGQQ